MKKSIWIIYGLIFIFSVLLKANNAFCLDSSDKWGMNRSIHIFLGLYCNWALQKFIAVNNDDDKTNDVGPATSAGEAQDLLDRALSERLISLSEYDTASHYNNVEEGWGNAEMIMKWNDAWPDEGGWIFSQIWNYYAGDNGQAHGRVSYIVIHYVSEAYDFNGKSIKTPWPDGIELYDIDGRFVGRGIWGHFVITFEYYEDPYGGYHGTLEPIPTP